MTVFTGARLGTSWGYAPGDSGWGDSFNLQARLIDAMVGLLLLSVATASPPSTSPIEDDAYYVPSGATGAWIGNSGKVATWQGGAWQFYPCPKGMRAYVLDQTAFYWFNGVAWTAEVTSAGGVTSVAGRSGVVTLSIGDVSGAAGLTSPTFGGSPTVPNQPALSRNGVIVNSKYVDDAISAAVSGTSVTSVAGRGGAVTLTHADITDWGTTLSAYALSSSLASYATTSYVDTRITNLINGAPAAFDTLKELSDQMASDESGVSALVTTVGTKVAYSGGTMTGVLSLYAGSTVTTPAGSDNSTNISNTSWVRTYVASLGYVTSGTQAVSSVAGRTGAITLSAADVSGLGTAAPHDVAYFAQAANNLSDLASAVTARSNLGLGSAALQPSTAFKTAGAAEPWSNLPAEAQQLPLAFIIPGKPIASQVYNLVMVMAMTLPANFAGTLLYQGTLTTAAAAFTLNKISGGTTTAIGTVTAGTATKTTITLSTQAAVSFVAGDVLQLVCPGTQDATLADLGLTMLAYKV